MVTELNETNFEDFTKDGIVLVDFWAAWCGPCKMAAPIIDKVAEEYSGKIRAGKVDIDECRGIAVKFAIESIPTVVIFKDGQEVKRVIGVHSFDDYCDLIDSFL